MTRLLIIGISPLKKSRRFFHNLHFNARHPLPIVEDVLGALADLVTVASVERLGRREEFASK